MNSDPFYMFEQIFGGKRTGPPPKWDPRNPTRFSYGEKRPGMVYIAQCGDIYKIGFTTRSDKGVKARLVTWGNKAKINLIFYHGIRTNHVKQLEAYLHEIFRRYQVVGEFFRLSDAELHQVKQIITFNGEPVVHVTELDLSY